jgi:hypothetical protein
MGALESCRVVRAYGVTGTCQHSMDKHGTHPSALSTSGMFDWLQIHTIDSKLKILSVAASGKLNRW